MFRDVRVGVSHRRFWFHLLATLLRRVSRAPVERLESSVYIFSSDRMAR